MKINMPPRARIIEVPLNDKEHWILINLASCKDMTPQALMRMALRWYQLLEETPGAYAAVNALRPQLGPGGCMGDDE